MKAIKVLGTGCPKCHKLSDNTVQAAQRLGVEFELEKITDVMKFADFGVMMTPALIVDGKVIVQGRAPSVDELEKLLA